MIGTLVKLTPRFFKRKKQVEKEDEETLFLRREYEVALRFAEETESRFADLGLKTVLGTASSHSVEYHPLCLGRATVEGDRYSVGVGLSPHGRLLLLTKRDGEKETLLHPWVPEQMPPEFKKVAEISPDKVREAIEITIWTAHRKFVEEEKKLTERQHMLEHARKVVA